MKFIKLILAILFIPLMLCSNIKPGILVVAGRLALENGLNKTPNVDWYDGFVQAMNLLEEKYEVYWASPKDLKNGNVDFNLIDLVFVKTYWNTPTEKAARAYCPSHLPKALLISATRALPGRSLFYHYDVLFYETFWFGKKLKCHPHTIHAFGINSDIMCPPEFEVEKIYDYIMVADATWLGKRPEKILQKKGRRLAILGPNSKGSVLAKQCIAQGIEVLDQVDHRDLTYLYQQSKVCYIPSVISGGGDRSILEARSCGIEVEVEPDNPKLKELTTSPIYDHHYYAQQLEKGIQILLQQKKQRR